MTRKKNYLFGTSEWEDIQYAGKAFRGITNSFLDKKLQPLTSESLSSWRTDQPGTGLKSTQQIFTDWSNFANHCFFNSAEAKVNLAFDKIINSFPFDGKAPEVWDYMDNLTGFDAYILSKFPKQVGYFTFHSADKNYITFDDRTGYLFPALSRNSKYEASIIKDVSEKHFQIDFHYAFPNSGIGTTQRQVLFQHISTDGYSGVTIGVDATASSDKSYKMVAIISSGSASDLKSLVVEKQILRGVFNHIAIQYDRTDTEKLYLILNSTDIVSSSNQVEFEKLPVKNKKALIGYGDISKPARYVDSGGSIQTWSPADTLTGSMDDFKIWSKSHTPIELREIADDGVTAQDELNLYFKFNEATGSYSNANITLDYSGNGLHGQINSTSGNYSPCRLSGSYSVPVVNENENMSPILFPSHPDVISLNENLLISASRYDINNPNLITKLVPKHYFLESQFFEGFETEDGDIAKVYNTKTNFPSGGKIPQAQVLTMFLLIWANYFDELKIYLDTFKTLRLANYDSEDSIPLQFMPFLARFYGFELPNPFSDASPAQYHDTKNLKFEKGRTTSTLKQTITQLWAQLLIQFPYLLRSKGTIKSIKSLMNAVGLDIETGFRMREYGGSKTLTLTDSRVKKSSNYKFLNFKNINYFKSSNLKAYRHCPGAPDNASGPGASKILLEAGDIVIVQPADAPTLTQFTSGSWSYEGHYNLDPESNILSQSLMRIESENSVGKKEIYVNLVACRKDKQFADLDQKVQLFLSSSVSINGAIATVDTISTNTGTKWPAGTYTVTDGISGVTAANGTDAVCSITIDSSGVATVSVTNGGKGYQINSSWSVPDSQIGNAGGDPLTFDVASLVPIADVSAQLTIPGVNIWDGSRWYVNVDHELGKDYSKINLHLSRPTVDGIFASHSASYYYATSTDNVLGAFSSLYTPNGPYFIVGQETPGNYDDGFLVRKDDVDTTSHLNSLTAISASVKQYDGQLSAVRFWTKSLTDVERREHAINPYSVGADDPITNYNFITPQEFNIANLSTRYEGSVPQGGWERLRGQYEFYQEITGSNPSSGKLTIDDISQNLLSATAGGATPGVHGQEVISSKPFYFSIINPDFDQFITTNKIRVNSYLDPIKAHKNNLAQAPLYNPSELSAVDDRRFSIEMSSVQRVNEDMVNIISDLGLFNEYLGAPELEYAVNYPKLEHLREKYFNRLTDKINYKSLYDFFKWFSLNFGPLIDRMMPNTVQFFGVNFVIESHFLERHKYEYKQGDVHVDIYDRRAAELPPLDIIGTITNEVL
tara:strand:+ start:6374 stop:10222 length:3849 start_codon:yes stop_codon:yes gene_type:complete